MVQIADAGMGVTPCDTHGDVAAVLGQVSSFAICFIVRAGRGKDRHCYSGNCNDDGVALSSAWAMASIAVQCLDR